MKVECVVEVPKGNRNKYEVDHSTGRVRLDRTLFTSTHYPGDYGFLEDTLAKDGDPLDVLILPDLDRFLLAEIAHFFEVYKALEPGKGALVGGWHGLAAAKAEIADAVQRAHTPRQSA